MPLVRQPRQTLLLIQALRAVAVSLVVFYHAGAVIFPEPKYFGTRPLGHLPDMGHSGVDLFFVISGFVITFAHHRDIGMPRRAPLYLHKRLVRIYPPYFVAFAIMLAASVATHAPTVNTSPINIIDNLLLLPGTWGHEILSVAWTLRFEMLFYALFLLCILYRGLFVPMVAALAILPIAGYCLAGFSAHWIVLLNPQLTQFAMGVCIARIFATSAQRDLAWPAASCVLGVLLFGLGYARGVILGTDAEWDLTSVLVLGIASTGIVYGLASIERSHNVSAPRWLSWIGGASYSIYLVHFPALSFLAKLWTRAGLRDALPAIPTLLLFMALAIAAGCLFHLVVERPLLWWLQPPRRPAVSRAVAPGFAGDR